MFGDPLHFLILFSNDAAWAWDLNTSREEPAGRGNWTVALRTTRHLPTPVYDGDCAVYRTVHYRINHPAIIVSVTPRGFYFAGYVLPRKRVTAGCSLAGWLMLANWSEINSGTVKEAYMSLLTLTAPECWFSSSRN